MQTIRTKPNMIPTKYIIPVLTFVVGTLFGSGAIWQWGQLELGKNQHELQKSKNIIAINEKIADLLIETNELKSDWIEERENQNDALARKKPSEHQQRKVKPVEKKIEVAAIFSLREIVKEKRKLNSIKKRIEINSNLVAELERQLATIEVRTPREIDLKLNLPRSPVFDLE